MCLFRAEVLSTVLIACVTCVGQLLQDPLLLRLAKVLQSVTTVQPDQPPFLQACIGAQLQC